MQNDTAPVIYINKIGGGQGNMGPHRVVSRELIHVADDIIPMLLSCYDIGIRKERLGVYEPAFAESDDIENALVFLPLTGARLFRLVSRCCSLWRYRRRRDGTFYADSVQNAPPHLNATVLSELKLGHMRAILETTERCEPKTRG